MAVPSRSDEVFRALADPTRRRILDLLVERGTLTVGQLAGEFPDLVASGISKHLMGLRATGLVTSQRVGRQQHYRFEGEGRWPPCWRRGWPGTSPTGPPPLNGCAILPKNRRGSSAFAGGRDSARLPRHDKAPADYRPGLACCSGNGGPSHSSGFGPTVRPGGSPVQGNAIVWNVPHGVTAPFPLMPWVPAMPGM